MQVGLLEIAELALGLLAEGRRAPLGRIADLGEDLVPRRLHLVDPVVTGGQDRLGGGEVRGRGPEVDHQFLKRFDLGKGTEPVPMGRHFRGVVAEVLELAGRGVGLQGFEEGLGLVQFGAQLLDFVLGQQAAAPEEQPGLQALLHEHQPLHGVGDGLLQLLNRLVLALGDQLGHARREPEQFEERLERREVPVLGPLDVLELGQLVDAGPGQLRQPRGVELLARDGQHQLAGVDQRGQHDHGPFGFEPERLRGQVLHAEDVLDQLGAVDHLAVALLLGDAEDVLGVLRPVGIEPLAVEKLQRVQHRGGLLGAVLSGDGAQGVLRGLGPVRSGDEHREERVFGSLVLEVGPKADARDGVHQVAEVDALMGADARKLADGLALGPLGQGLGAPLVGDLEGRGHVLLQPLHEVAQEVRRLGFVGGLGVARGGGRQVQGRGVTAKRRAELLVRVRQAQEQLVGLLLVLEVRRIEGLDEVEVEVPRRHRRGALVGRAEEQVALARGLALQPFELVLPDLVAGDVGLVGALHDPPERLVVVAVELRGIEALGPLLDQGVEVVGLLEVQVVLAVVRVGRDELPAHRLEDFPQDGLHLGEQVVGRIAAQFLDAGLEEAEAVAQFLCRRAQGGVDVARREPVDRQRVDELQAPWACRPGG